MTLTIAESGIEPAADLSPEISAGQRATSIDCFRGMLLVVSAMVWLASPALHEWPQNPVFGFLTAQFGPSIWHGVTLYDLLLPGFLFVAGISTAKSVARRRSQGQTRSAILSHLMKRCLMLVAVGIVLGNLSIPAWPNIRWLGVLQRIGICQFAVGALSLVADRTIQLVVASIVLVNYGIAFDAFATAPPVGTSQRSGTQTIDPYSVEYNIAAQIDKAWLPGRKYQGNWDAQGLLTTVPALVIMLCGAIVSGLLCGNIGTETHAGSNRSVLAVLCVMVVLGLMLDRLQPMNSFLLTPAFVLFTVGVCGIALVGFNFLDGRSSGVSPLRAVVAMGQNSLLIAVAMGVARNIIPLVIPFVERTFEVTVAYPPTLVAIWGGMLVWICGRLLAAGLNRVR